LSARSLLAETDPLRAVIAPENSRASSWAGMVVARQSCGEVGHVGLGRTQADRWPSSRDRTARPLAVLIPHAWLALPHKSFAS